MSRCHNCNKDLDYLDHYSKDVKHSHFSLKDAKVDYDLQGTFTDVEYACPGCLTMLCTKEITAVHLLSSSAGESDGNAFGC